MLKEKRKYMIKSILLTLVTICLSIGTARAQELAPAAEAESASAEKQAVVLGEVIDQLVANEDDAAQAYAERIHKINAHTTLTAQQKRVARECARVNFMARIDACRGVKTPGCKEKADHEEAPIEEPPVTK
jgi:hypothetical protein